MKVSKIDKKEINEKRKMEWESCKIRKMKEKNGNGQ